MKNITKSELRENILQIIRMSEMNDEDVLKILNEVENIIAAPIIHKQEMEEVENNLDEISNRLDILEFLLDVADFPTYEEYI